MKAYWHSLNEREKWMVILAALCLGIYAYYLFLYAPLSTQIDQKQQLLTEKIATLDWMEKVKQRHATTTKKKQIDNSELLTILATQLKANRSFKEGYQLQQTNTGEVQISFNEVPFNGLMQWLTALNEQYNLTIKQFESSSSTTPGVVKLMLIISAD